MSTRMNDASSLPEDQIDSVSALQSAARSGDAPAADPSARSVAVTGTVSQPGSEVASAARSGSDSRTGPEVASATRSDHAAVSDPAPAARSARSADSAARPGADVAQPATASAPAAQPISNPTLDLIERRSSTRAFAPIEPTEEQRAAVLHAASRAPSAGAMMMYSIIDIRKPATLERLADLCDHQPFIAHAPWALLFVVDYAKWIALFEHVGCFDASAGMEGGVGAGEGEVGSAGASGDVCMGAGASGDADVLGGAGAGAGADAVALGGAGAGGLDGVGAGEAEAAAGPGPEPRRAPGLGEFAIAAQDAVIAAQTAAIAAESVGLGSCYIGDVVERCEEVAELLELPAYTVPLSLLVLGVPAKRRPATPHATENLVMLERYTPADAATLDAQVAELDAKFRPHATEPGARVRDIYERKHQSAFMVEMGRSMGRWLGNWMGEDVIHGEDAEGSRTEAAPGS